MSKETADQFYLKPNMLQKSLLLPGTPGREGLRPTYEIFESQQVPDFKAQVATQQTSALHQLL